MDRSSDILVQAQCEAAAACLLEIHSGATVGREGFCYDLGAARVITCTASSEHDICQWQINEPIGIERCTRAPIIVDIVRQVWILIQGYAGPGIAGACRW